MVIPRYNLSQSGSNRPIYMDLSSGGEKWFKLYFVSRLIGTKVIPTVGNPAIGV